MAGASVTKSVACPHCGKLIDKTKIQDRNAGLFCDDCAAGMRAESAKRVERQCPACARSIGEDDVVCQGCGFDYRIGYSPKAVAAQTAVSGTKRLCQKCGYDCTSLYNAVRCPECGQGLAFSVSRARKEEIRQIEMDPHRLLQQFFIPLLIAAVAVGGYVGFMFATAQSGLIPLGLSKMAVRFGSLLFVTYCSMFIWLEVEISWQKIMVRLLAVAACGYFAEQVIWDASNLLIAYPFVTIIMLVLILKALELELSDGFILVMLNWPVVFLALMFYPPSLRFM